MGGVNCPDVGGTRGAASPSHSPPVIEIYTDGAAIHCGEKTSCGWACKLIYQRRYILKSGGAIGKTSNQMEMRAVLNALQSVRDKSIPTVVYSDSRYTVGILNGWFAIHKNGGKWKQLFAEKQKFSNIRFIWVKGHAGIADNEDVDFLAKEEARKQLKRQKEWRKVKNNENQNRK